MKPDPTRDIQLMFSPMTWVKAASQCDFPVQPLLADLGIATPQGIPPFISVNLTMQLMAECVERAKPHHHFPFVLGETFVFEKLPPIEIFIATSQTLRECFKVFDWLESFLPILKVIQQPMGNHTHLVFELDCAYALPEHRLYTKQSILAAVSKFGRMLVGTTATAEALCLSEVDSPHVAQYEQLFRCPVRLGQSWDGVVFSSDFLDMPLKGAFPTIHSQAQSMVEEKLASLAVPTNIADQLVKVLTEKPALLAQGIEAVSAQLQMHPRTLQRRLQAQDAKYSDLQARAQLQLAQEWLCETELSIEDISDRLGFSDRHSFSRAFKRWANATPSEHRRLHKTKVRDR